MLRYLNLGGNSSISFYENGSDFVRVQFNDGATYLYNYASTGADNIEHMKELAAQGHGLNSFIGRVIRKRYACKEH